MPIARVIQVLIICYPIWSFHARSVPNSNKTSPREGCPPADSIVPAKLPPNISAPIYMRPILNQMLLRSATFREQCKKISNSGRVRVTLLLVPPGPPRTYRAVSRIMRDKDKNAWITIELPACASYFELVGHEFEHAAEQVEGLNLKVLSTQRNSHVYRLNDGTYETDRAIEAGRRVARECAFKSSVKSDRGCKAPRAR